MKANKRIITKYIGDQEGPMLLVFGSMHGNEPAGIKAIEYVGKMLDVEPIRNSDFYYKGSFIGLAGNMQAIAEGERYLTKDLNRSWTDDNVNRVMNADKQDLQHEDVELREILETVNELILEVKPTKLIVVDLHTTSSHGGIFSLPTQDPESLEIARELHAPVILGMLKGIKGTSLHYFRTETMGIDTVALAFESGQHEEKLSVNRAIAALVNCMRTIECVHSDHVENQHDSILIEYSKDLPKVSELVDKYAIENQGDFKMKLGYTNFQKVIKGEYLADDGETSVHASVSGRILMPLYQKRGEDGFFLIKESDV